METSMEGFDRDWRICGWVPPCPLPGHLRETLFPPGSVITFRRDDNREGIYTVDWRMGPKSSGSGAIRKPLSYDSETKVLSVVNSEIDIGGNRYFLEEATAGLVREDLLALRVFLGNIVEGNPGTIIAEASSGQGEHPDHRRSRSRR